MAFILNRKTNHFPQQGMIAWRGFSGLKAISGVTALTMLLAALCTAPQVSAEPSLDGNGVKPAPKTTSSPKQPNTAQQNIFMDRKVVINIPSRTLWVYEGSQIIRYFPVGVGRPGFMTPVGKYAIISKVTDPGWENPYMPQGKVRLAPGDNNPLGTRWMGFYQKSGGEYGMHGTDNPASVGKFSSHGCVRMKVKDAEALFDLVDMGTPVEVIYEPVLIRKQANQIRVTVYADKFKRGMPTVDQLKAKILKQYPDAQVDTEKLHEALLQANEHPVSVGALPAEDILQLQVADPTTGKPTSAAVQATKPVPGNATASQQP